MSPVDLEGMFYLSTAALLATYFGLRLLLASRFGRIIVGIRENERRAELLGYDPRAYKLATFTIGAALAGLAGCLFANWGAFVSPTIFGLAQSAQIIIWVIVGGRGTLIGPIIGCIGIQWLSALLGENQPSGAGSWAALAQQCAARPRRHPHRLCASGAEGAGCRRSAIGEPRCFERESRRRSAISGLSRRRRRDDGAAPRDAATSACASAAFRPCATSTSRSPSASCAASSAPMAPAKAPSSRC